MKLATQDDQSLVVFPFILRQCIFLRWPFFYVKHSWTNYSKKKRFLGNSCVGDEEVKYSNVIA